MLLRKFTLPFFEKAEDKAIIFQRTCKKAQQQFCDMIYTLKTIFVSFFSALDYFSGERNFSVKMWQTHNHNKSHEVLFCTYTVMIIRAQRFFPEKVFFP